MAASTILVSLDADVENRLAELAQASNQPIAEVAAAVLSHFVASNSPEYLHIQQGLAELEHGQGIPHQQVASWIDTLGTAQELPMPQ